MVACKISPKVWTKRVVISKRRRIQRLGQLRTYGLFVQDGSMYSGYEQWLIYANESWRAQGYSDCIIQWSVSATEGAPGSATSANFALDVARRTSDRTVHARRNSCMISMTRMPSWSLFMTSRSQGTHPLVFRIGQQSRFWIRQ